MSKESDRLARDAEKLRCQVADCEAQLAHLKARLARVESRLSGEPPPETGLDLLWDAALPMCRLRSKSKLVVRKAWFRIPAHERPKISDAIAALRAWNRCPEWRKDDGAFVCGLDRWLLERRWTNPPIPLRDPTAPKPRPVPPPQSPEDIATQEDIYRIFHPEKQ